MSLFFCELCCDESWRFFLVCLFFGVYCFVFCLSCLCVFEVREMLILGVAVCGRFVF